MTWSATYLFRPYNLTTTHTHSGMVVFSLVWFFIRLVLLKDEVMQSRIANTYSIVCCGQELVRGFTRNFIRSIPCGRICIQQHIRDYLPQSSSNIMLINMITCVCVHLQVVHLCLRLYKHITHIRWFIFILHLLGYAAAFTLRWLLVFVVVFFSLFYSTLYHVYR